MWHLRPLTGRAATRQQSAVLIWLILPIGRQIEIETKRKARDRILSSMPHLYMLLCYIIIYISWLLTQSLILNHNETTLIIHIYWLNSHIPSMRNFEHHMWQFWQPFYLSPSLLSVFIIHTYNLPWQYTHTYIGGLPFFFLFF